MLCDAFRFAPGKKRLVCVFLCSANQDFSVLLFFCFFLFVLVCIHMGPQLWVFAKQNPPCAAVAAFHANPLKKKPDGLKTGSCLCKLGDFS